MINGYQSIRQFIFEEQDDTDTWPYDLEFPAVPIKKGMKTQLQYSGTAAQYRSKQ